MKITIVGAGYVGLVTGTCLAEVGNEIICVDKDQTKIKQMQKGIVPIYEPGLEVLFKRNIKENRLTFTTDLKEGIKDAAIIFLALPTPPDKDGSADLSYVLGVADKLGSLLNKYTIVVDKSTVPVGTAEQVKKHIAENSKVEFDVLSNPEFLREGFAVSDFMRPDRIVVGSSSKKANSVMDQLYKPFVSQSSPIIFMDERSAEMTKYAANAFLATKISFMNEIANLCERLDADVDQVRIGVGADDRIGNRFLLAGHGYGGSCFPKDVKALLTTAREHDYKLEILSAVEAVNETQKKRLPEKISAYYKGKVEGKVFALWGLAFKPDTDDIRESPAIEVMKSLTAAGAKIVAYDPEAMANVKKYHGKNDKLTFAANEYEALKDADALLIATEWSPFREPDFTKMKRMLKSPVIFDGRNLYDLETMRSQGFYYSSIGRGTVHG